MTIHNKLVRDRIVEIIEDNDGGCTYRTLEQDEYVQALQTKLQEEVNEYTEAQNVEELADVLEVVFALAKTHGVSVEELMAVRDKKRVEKGGFDAKLFLVEVSGQ